MHANDGRRFICKGKSAYEAAANVGLKLSECRDNITWTDLRETAFERTETDGKKRKRGGNG